MNKKLLITVVASLFTISIFSQIEIGKIEKAVEVEKKVNFPPYNPTENFIEHSEYYRAKVTHHSFFDLDRDFRARGRTGIGRSALLPRTG